MSGFVSYSAFVDEVLEDNCRLKKYTAHLLEYQKQLEDELTELKCSKPVNVENDLKSWLPTISDWIKWAGNKYSLCPGSLEDETLIVWLRDGSYGISGLSDVVLESCFNRGSCWDWSVEGVDGDIIAYRIIDDGYVLTVDDLEYTYDKFISEEQGK
jgi:hypothetical protein